MKYYSFVLAILLEWNTHFIGITRIMFWLLSMIVIIFIQLKQKCMIQIWLNSAVMHIGLCQCFDQFYCHVRTNVQCLVECEVIMLLDSSFVMKNLKFKKL